MVLSVELRGAESVLLIVEVTPSTTGDTVTVALPVRLTFVKVSIIASVATTAVAFSKRTDVALTIPVTLFTSAVVTFSSTLVAAVMKAVLVSVTTDVVSVMPYVVSVTMMGVVVETSAMLLAAPSAPDGLCFVAISYCFS